MSEEGGPLPARLRKLVVLALPAELAIGAGGDREGNREGQEIGDAHEPQLHR